MISPVPAKRLLYKPLFTSYDKWGLLVFFSKKKASRKMSRYFEIIDACCSTLVFASYIF